MKTFMGISLKSKNRLLYDNIDKQVNLWKYSPTPFSEKKVIQQLYCHSTLTKCWFLIG